MRDLPIMIINVPIIMADNNQAMPYLRHQDSSGSSIYLNIIGFILIGLFIELLVITLSQLGCVVINI